MTILVQSFLWVRTYERSVNKHWLRLKKGFKKSVLRSKQAIGGLFLETFSMYENIIEWELIFISKKR